MTSHRSIFGLPADLHAPFSTAGLSLGWCVVTTSIDDKLPGTLIELSKNVTVFSRGAQADTAIENFIDIDDQFVSTKHASIFRPQHNSPNESFSIRDRIDPGPSANGTFVNNHKLTPGEIFELSEGDVIRIGRTEILFKSLWLPSASLGTR